MTEKNKYTNKEIVTELKQLKIKLSNTKIVYQNRISAYVVALCFLFGTSILAYGIGRYNDWDILISIGVSLIALAFFVLWVSSEGDL